MTLTIKYNFSTIKFLIKIINYAYTLQYNNIQPNEF